MKQLKFLLKLSVITIASLIVSNNNFVYASAAGGAESSLEDLCNVDKCGDHKDCVKHFVYESINSSKSEWAKGAIGTPGNEWSNSIKCLQDVISLYLVEDECGFRHQRRVRMLGGKIQSIVMHNQSMDHQSDDVLEWSESECGKNILGLINGLMACHTAYLVTTQCADGLYETMFNDVLESLGCEPRTILEKDTDYCRDCCQDEGYSYWFSPSTAMKSILKHFGYSGDEGDKKSLEQSFQNLKKYLYHDFYCYFVQTGMIEFDGMGYLSEESPIEKIKTAAWNVNYIRKQIEDINGKSGKFRNLSKERDIRNIVDVLDKEYGLSDFVNNFNEILKVYNGTTLKEDVYDENYLDALESFIVLQEVGYQKEVLKSYEELIGNLSRHDLVNKENLTTKVLIEGVRLLSINLVCLSGYLDESVSNQSKMVVNQNREKIALDILHNWTSACIGYAKKYKTDPSHFSRYGRPRASISELPAGEIRIIKLLHAIFDEMGKCVAGNVE